MSDFINNHLKANLDENVSTGKQALIAVGVAVACLFASLPFIAKAIACD